MFPEVTGFIRYINDVIKMIPEVSNDEVLRSAEKIPQRENDGAGIRHLIIFFDGKTYKSEKNFRR